MNHVKFLIFFFSLTGALLLTGQSNESAAFQSSKDLQIEEVASWVEEDLSILVMEIEVIGKAGVTVPEAAGRLDGAPVLGYVFPTNLAPENVGFGAVEGTLALALTSHPDFDDTPLWDENADRNLQNDGVIWHPHWVVLQKDERVPGGLSVREFEKTDTTVQLPPTNPGMPMYMDSPGFPVTADGAFIRVAVPLYRIQHRTDFKFDAVAAYMEVNTSDAERPMLGVYAVYSIASEDLSLPYGVKSD